MVKSCVLQFPCEMPLRMSTQSHWRPMAQNHFAPISAIVNGNPVLQSRVTLQLESSLFSLSARHPRRTPRINLLYLLFPFYYFLFAIGKNLYHPSPMNGGLYNPQPIKQSISLSELFKTGQVTP